MYVCMYSIAKNVYFEILDLIITYVEEVIYLPTLTTYRENQNIDNS